jgi:hypothetical protein
VDAEASQLINAKTFDEPERDSCGMRDVKVQQINCGFGLARLLVKSAPPKS